MGKGGGGNADLEGDLAGMQTVRSPLYQQAEDGEPGFLGKGREGFSGVFRFHNSIIMEMYGLVKESRLSGFIRGGF